MASSFPKLINMTVKGTITPGQRGPERNDNEGVLYTYHITNPNHQMQFSVIL